MRQKFVKRHIRITVIRQSWPIAARVAKLSNMEMFDVGPTLGASVAKVSRTEVLRVGSTSGATVENVSNIDVFEVGANIVLLSQNSLRELPHSTNVSARSRLLTIFADYSKTLFRTKFLLCKVNRNN